MSLAIGLAVSLLAIIGLTRVLLVAGRAVHRTYRRIAWYLGTVAARVRVRRAPRPDPRDAHLVLALQVAAQAQQLCALQAIIAAQDRASMRRGGRP